jgi:hypothetical protein
VQWATKLRLEVGKEKVHKVVEMCSPPDLITFTLPLTPQGPFKARNGLVSVRRPLQCFTGASAGSHLDTQRRHAHRQHWRGDDEQGDSAQLLCSCRAADNSTWIFFPTHPPRPCFHTAASTKECALHELCMSQLRHITLGCGLEYSYLLWHGVCLKASAHPNPLTDSCCEVAVGVKVFVTGFDSCRSPLFFF